MTVVFEPEIWAIRGHAFSRAADAGQPSTVGASGGCHCHGDEFQAAEGLSRATAMPVAVGMGVGRLESHGQAPVLGQRPAGARRWATEEIPFPTPSEGVGRKAA